MKDALPTVSVIIPAKNAAGTLRRALESIRDQTYVEVVDVVVAAADAESAGIAEELGARVVDNPGGRTPAALNRALTESAGEVIVRCDSHCVLPPDYVERAVETLLRTQADNVGGMQVPVGNTSWERAIAAAMRSRLGAGDARYRLGGTEGPTETVYLGVYRRSTLERLGGFDEQFARTQDYELNHRIINSGGIVWFDPHLRVEYRPRSSLQSLWRQYFEYGRAKRQFGRKHPGALRWRQLAAPLLTLTVISSLLGSLWFPPLAAIAIAYAVSLLASGALSDGPTLKVAISLATMHLSWGLGFLLPITE